VTPGVMGGDRVDEGGAKMKTSLPSTHSVECRPIANFLSCGPSKSVYTLTLLA